MISTPSRPSEEYILGRLAFHESQIEWFNKHEQTVLAEWAKSMAEEWRGKLRVEQIKYERLV